MSEERPLQEAHHEREEFKKAVENHEQAAERERQADHEAQAAEANYRKIADPGGKRVTAEQERAWEAVQTAQAAHLNAARARQAADQRLKSAEEALQRHDEKTREIIATLDPDHSRQEIRDGFDLDTARYVFDRRIDSFDACTDSEKHRLINNISERLVGDIRQNPGDIQTFLSADFRRLTTSTMAKMGGRGDLANFLDPGKRFFKKWLDAFDAFRKKTNESNKKALLDSAGSLMMASGLAAHDIFNVAKQDREGQGGAPDPVNPAIAAELEALAAFVKRRMRIHLCEPSYATLIEHLELIPELPVSGAKEETQLEELRELAVGAVEHGNVLILLKSRVGLSSFGKARNRIKISVAKASEAVRTVEKQLNKDPGELETLARQVESVHDRFNECLTLIKGSDDESAVRGLRHAIDAVVYALDLRLQRTALQRAGQGQ